MQELTQATIAEIDAAMTSGAVTSKDLVELYRPEIAREDGAFNSIAFLNPDADDIADALDRERSEGRVRGHCTARQFW